MTFKPLINHGDVLSNKELCEIFKCAPQGGMRKSNTTNTLVIVSDHTKSLYEDRWQGNIFHYTGMGQVGNQLISFAQNKTLDESNKTKISVFLFEVFESGKYVFQGHVKLIDKPYKEKQQDKNKSIRSVWIFPLKLIGDSTVPSLPEETFNKKNKEREKKAKKTSDDDLIKRLEYSPTNPGTRAVLSKQFERNQDVVEFVKRRAKGICQLCGSKAPFINKNGEPFLEVHHIEWLSEGGEDSIENAVALCPNCHRKIHILNLESDKEFLRKTCQSCSNR